MLAGRLMSAGCGSGLFVALPTMATSNAMYDWLVKVYKHLFLLKSTPSWFLLMELDISETYMASIAGHHSEAAG